VQELLARALTELRQKAAEADELRSQAATLRAKAAEAEAALEEKEAELLWLKKQHEQVREEDNLLHKVKTITSKGKLEKTGSTTVHTSAEQLRALFMTALDQALVAPPSAGTPPPEAIVHTLSEKDAAVLIYRNLAVRNMGGMTSTELFEFHLHVTEDPEDPNIITLRWLSDEEAKHLCGELYFGLVQHKRAKVTKLKRVQVRRRAYVRSIRGNGN
jgi:hypothetical protein